ncbi:hypothetical protein [Variovorax sp. 278MFTsu5.1]|uniref:hypothetical protein n=1 Tax=Variovorax sp. 278MFTsu5.1 TaxID=3158366 RepID=UPI003AAB7853
MSMRDEFEQMARSVGELEPNEPIRESLVEFAELVTARCARIGDQYGDWDRNAGDHIRAELYDLPGLLPTPRQSDHEPS